MRLGSPTTTSRTKIIALFGTLYAVLPAGCSRNDPVEQARPEGAHGASISEFKAPAE